MGAESLEVCFQIVEARQQRLHLVDGDRLHVDLLNGRLEAVRHFTQAHGACQTRATFECVQGTQDFAAGAQIVRTSCPLAQCATQLGQQFGSLFLENREQVGINNVHNVNVVVHVSTHQGCRIALDHR